MPEIGTSGSMSGDRKRGVAEWPSYRAILDFTSTDVPIALAKVCFGGGRKWRGLAAKETFAEI